MSESIAKEKRTAVAWRQSCLKLLGAVHADYHWNRDVGGRCIEFVRTDASGLHLSYNFVRIREEYHLGFAVTLSLERSETVATAFAAGSRFDHNRTIWRLLAEDVGLSRGD